MQANFKPKNFKFNFIEKKKKILDNFFSISIKFQSDLNNMQNLCKNNANKKLKVEPRRPKQF